MYMACSATDTELAMPVVISGILRLLSAGTSTCVEADAEPRHHFHDCGETSSSAWLVRRAAECDRVGVLELGMVRGGHIA